MSSRANSDVVKVPEKTLDKIFDLLKRKGPLCASQVSVELLLSPNKVMAGLKRLYEEGVVELRPDRDVDNNVDEELTPWGLTRSFARRKAS